MRSSHHVVAIDGPAASGKSSVARELARRLGFIYVNSGAMYRTVTWQVLRQGVDPGDAAAVTKIAESMPLVCDLKNNESQVKIGDFTPTDLLWSDPVNNSVSLVSRVPRVREILVEKLRSYAVNHDVVMEGRDIGSVVFPETPYKFYIDASPAVRLSRRKAQGQHDQIAARDRADSSRRNSPLIIAKDAQVIDSSQLTVEQVVDNILGRLKQLGLKAAKKVK